MKMRIDEIIADLEPYMAGIYGHKKALLPHILPLIPPDCGCLGESFGGTGIVTAAVKRLGIRVITNDVMRFAVARLRALVANNGTTLTEEELAMLSAPSPDSRGCAREHYHEFLGPTNADWFDSWGANIPMLDGAVKRGLAVFMPVVTIMQWIKANRNTTNFSPNGSLTGNRHLKNLDLMAKTIEYARTVFPLLLHDNGRENEVHRMDALDFVSAVTCDCLYVDSPYCCAGGQYLDKVFLYDRLVRILEGEGHLIRRFRSAGRDKPGCTDWVRRDNAMAGFAELFRRSARIPLVLLSYNTTSDIAPAEIASVAASYGRKVRIHSFPHPRPTTKLGGADNGGIKETVEVILECR